MARKPNITLQTRNLPNIDTGVTPDFTKEEIDAAIASGGSYNPEKKTLTQFIRGSGTSSIGGAETNISARSSSNRTANSSGAYYGTAGINRMGTSATSGRTTTSTTGERTGVDRSSAIVNDPITTYLDLFSPKTMLGRQDEIRRELANQRQAQIDAIQNTYRGAADTLAQNKEEDLARQRSLNLRAGLAGSDFGTAAKIKVRDAYDVKARDLAATRDTAIAGAIKDIEDMANQRIQLTESGLQSGLQNTMTLRNDAVTRIALLGKSGLDVDTIRERDPQLYETIAVASGMGDVELEAILNANKPAPAKIDYQTIVRGGKITMFGVDPTTGQIKILEQDAGIPDEYDTIQAQNGTILGVPKNWDGDPQKIVTLGSYRKPLASELGGGAGGGGVSTSNDPEKTRTQIQFLNRTVDQALERASASGASGLSKTLGDKFIGDTRYRQLESLTNTLRTNVLALMTDPTVKKFFGPQMSNADVQLMTAAGTTLNPELQSPALMKEELERLKGLFTRIQNALPKNEGGNDNEIEVRAPDGTVGTIPQEQLQQALAEGYTQI